MPRSGPPAAPPRRALAAGLWGDGFAGDGFAAARSMSTWDGCSSDEYAMLFPRLLPADGRLPPPLAAHLKDCVAVRAWRLARLEPGVPCPVGDGWAPGEEAAAALHRAWFADDGAVACLLRQMGLLRTAPSRLAGERRLLAMLDEVLGDVRRGRAPAWTRDREAWFGFGSGIHPAYLWPESAISPDRGCTAAWLGHLDRGRTALMPLAVADYLADAVLGSPRSVDRTVAAMVETAEDARRLRRAAARRLAGGDPAVSFARGRHRGFAPLLGAPRPAVQRRGDEFEHA